MKTQSRVKRPLHPMPEFIKKALEEHQLLNEYQCRPAYQRNDYIGWINRAKLEKTKKKRLNQMLDELKKGGIYMKMTHLPSRKNWKRDKNNISTE